ncbi:MAG TPA: GNAT family protein [Pyrinomonadaceae bacterium]|nr:GNAT family protein [Pyrinomonadaceae bacterium]
MTKPFSCMPFLSGKDVYLRPLVSSDAEGAYVSWFNDEEVCAGNSHHVFPYNPDAALSYIRYAGETKDSVILAVVLVKGDQHIGNIALTSIHPVNRTAEFSIVIGDKAAWGKGYGKEAARLLCDHGFYSLNLHRIQCGTFENNEGMQRLAAYLGMKEEGVRREAVFKNGRYLNVIEYGVLRSEYTSLWPREDQAGK